MLSQPQVQRYSTECGLREMMIAEKEVLSRQVAAVMTCRHCWSLSMFICFYLRLFLVALRRSSIACRCHCKGREYRCALCE
jgi:hypothetical protein